MTTTVQLRERVAEHIRIAASDLDLSSEDAAKIDRAIQEATDFLRELGLIWWVDNAIPAAAVMPMTLIVSALAGPRFGKIKSGYEEGFLGGRAMLTQLKPSAYTARINPDYF